MMTLWHILEHYWALISGHRMRAPTHSTHLTLARVTGDTFTEQIWQMWPINSVQKKVAVLVYDIVIVVNVSFHVEMEKIFGTFWSSGNTEKRGAEMIWYSTYVFRPDLSWCSWWWVLSQWARWRNPPAPAPAPRSPCPPRQRQDSATTEMIITTTTEFVYWSQHCYLFFLVPLPVQ